MTPALVVVESSSIAPSKYDTPLKVEAPAFTKPPALDIFTFAVNVDRAADSNPPAEVIVTTPALVVVESSSIAPSK